jgi:DNA modification methylase
MQNVKDSFDKKQQAFREMQESMTMAMNRNIKNQITLKKMEVTNEYKSDYCHIKLGDCVKLISEVPDNSVGFSIFSPPFAELYTYSDKLEDMGNSKDYKEFFTAFKFLVSELYRVMWAGRNVAVHCMDLPIQKGKEGFIGLRDFSGMILQAFEEVGFIYHSRVTIWKNPVTEMQRTKALGLLHKQVKKDSAMSRVGIPDYLMIFRKEGEHTHPVHCDISVDTWQKWASPVWMDIDYGNTLNASRGRDQNDEKHICPLQLDTIERAISLWSNEGDTVLTPFLGIGSEVYSAIKLNRYGIGFELKDSYFNEAVKNCKGIEITSHQPSLFSAI